MLKRLDSAEVMARVLVNTFRDYLVAHGDGWCLSSDVGDISLVERDGRTLAEVSLRDQRSGRRYLHAVYELRVQVRPFDGVETEEGWLP